MVELRSSSKGIPAFPSCLIERAELSRLMKAASPVDSIIPLRSYSHWWTASINAARRRNISYKVTLTCDIALPTSNILEYAGGRWLRKDEEQRRRRYLHCDFDQLCQRVIQVCTGATKIVSCEKGEDGRNYIFIFTCDNERRLVAKLPTSVAGPQRLTTNSEVATIKYRKLESLYYTSLII